ncbi:hypothetical protein Afil01_41790 [Actinorhabdospora filicis]|uniref:DUF418 domain-containing protein n=1 Tax=Actinorhabdospora filicis TaxID=1785913 RepID=A0A9W6W4L0_9ACTN|nr:DUF418 domain-containing protein [Actinorhabdospora filicis]GLZ79372.1 hypothetical protein Afil01_41790 [Actinorhabdospora filicis]
MTTEALPRVQRGPVRRAERALAPDLARGAMLLIIALANVAGVVFAGEPGVDTSPNGPEGVLNFLMFELVHARGYPVFAVMFGYGLVQLARRQDTSGATRAETRKVLLRRNAWLVAFGVVHAALLFYGDFLGAYGIVGIALTLLLLRRGDKFHRIVLWLWALTMIEMTVLAVITWIQITGASGDTGITTKLIGSMSTGDFFAAMGHRLAEWPGHTLTVVPFAMIAWLGMWAARRRVLEDPGAHLKLLRRTAVIGLGFAIAGGLPNALIAAGWLRTSESAASLASLVYGGTGMFAGPGYVALFGLIALRLGQRRGRVTNALVALGQRSLSGYLFQSIAWTVLLMPYGLHLADRTPSPAFAGVVIAVAVWLASVLLARWLDLRGSTGPAEKLLRRLTYGRR